MNHGTMNQPTAQSRDQGRRRALIPDDILEYLAHGKLLTGMLTAVVALIERELPDSIGSVLLLDEKRRRLLIGAAPRLPESYNQAIDGIEIGPAVGSCGTAAFTGQRVIAQDIETDPLWAPYRHLARAAGLRSCWSEPVFGADGRVLGTFAIYYRQPHMPTEAEIEVLTTAAHLTSIIVERHRAEESLRDREQQLRLLLEQMPAMLWIVDNELRITASTGSGLRAIGVVPGQLVGTRLQDYVGTEDLNDFPLAMHCRALAGESLHYEMEWHGRFLQVHLEPMRNQAGQITGCIGIAVDVTERKRAEAERERLQAQLLHAQKLESLGILAGGIAHDFNNFLTGILGYADLALREVPPNSTAHHLIAEAIKVTRRAAELTERMLAYSGKGRFVIEPVDLSALVIEMESLLKVSISKKCRLVLALASDLPAIEGDSAQIRQVLLNLVINASEAIGEREGVVTVATGVRHCTRAELASAYVNYDMPEGSYVYLEVADTGCGMAPEIQAKMFDPFFSTKFAGRGLGLSATLGIVRGHRGTIRCTSEPNQGTTFTVLFPAAAGRPKAELPPAAGEDAWRGDGKVVVADDEFLIRNMVGHMLRRLGFQVLLAADGQEAVELFCREANDVRLVLLDLTMPRLDGVEALRLIRAQRRDVPAILSSGYNEQTTAKRLTQGDQVVFLQKPYRFEELAAVVKQVLAARQA
ncbi:MAG: response regulator [Gemmataceae bacterium]|nr:response regulator [Gemmataceae bacterium]